MIKFCLKNITKFCIIEKYIYNDFAKAEITSTLPDKAIKMTQTMLFYFLINKSHFGYIIYKEL